METSGSFLFGLDQIVLDGSSQINGHIDEDKTTATATKN